MNEQETAKPAFTREALERLRALTRDSTGPSPTRKRGGGMASQRRA